MYNTNFDSIFDALNEPKTPPTGNLLSVEFDGVSGYVSEMLDDYDLFYHANVKSAGYSNGVIKMTATEPHIRKVFDFLREECREYAHLGDEDLFDYVTRR